MKIIIEKKFLLEALSRIQGIVEKTSIKPITANALIKAEKSSVSVSATNLQIGMTSFCENINVIEEGIISINARKIFEIVKELPEKYITITERDNYRIKIESGEDLKFNILGLPPEDFPNYIKEEEKEFIKWEKEKIVNFIKLTSFSMSKDETNPNICGVFIENIENSLIRIVTTDGYRISIVDDILGEKIKKEKGIIIPYKAVFELNKIMIEKEDEKTVYLAISKNSLLVKIGDVEVFIRLIEKQFPEYKMIIPGDGKKTAKTKIEKNSLKATLRRMSIISSVNNSPVIFSFRGNNLELFTEDSELGSVKEKLNLKKNNDKNFDFCINCHYLLDILNAVDKDVVIEFNTEEENKPIVVRPYDDEKIKYIIMPMIV